MSKRAAPKKPRAKKPKKQKGEEVGATEMLNRIRKQKDVVRAAQAEFHVAKDEASQLRKVMDHEQEKLFKLVELSQEPAPLFDGVQTDDKGQADLDTDDSWKDVKLEEVFAGLTAVLRQKVTDAALVTMNDITEWCKAKKLTDIPGVGEGNAKKLENAIDEFWQRRKEAAEATTKPSANGTHATAAPLEEGAKK
jgi:hypothetical protein